jgi:L-fuculose-phosphate aldolase
MMPASPLDEAPLSEWDAREQICEVGRRLWQRQYVEASAGNITYRLSDGRIVGTPTMISKGFMQPDDLVLLDLDGNQLGGKRKKTSEILVHLAILRERPDIRCVIHSHAPHATAFAITSGTLPKCIHPEIELFLGEVPIAPYETPGTQRVADSLLPFVKDYNVFLLASHGLVAAGTGILDAFWKTEITDAYCRLLILARSVGEPNRLNVEQMGELLQTKKNLGIPDRRLETLASIDCDAPPPASASSSPRDIEGDLIRRVVDAVVQRIGREGNA